MKLFNLRLSPALLLIVLAITLNSCFGLNEGVWKNDQIDKGKAETLHNLTQKVFKELKANNFKQLEYYLSKELIEENYTKRNAELVGNRLKSADYHLLDEYYIVNVYETSDTIKANVDGINSYTLTYTPFAREMYFAFFTPKTGENKELVTLVYSKYSYGWRVSVLDYGQYTVNGKTCPELFWAARERYQKGYTVDALNILALADMCKRPFSAWQYVNEAEMQKIYGAVTSDANAIYNFPYIVKEVPTQPRIFKIFNQKDDDGSYHPMIYYLTRVNIKDKAALKTENDQLQQVIGKIIPGIDKDKPLLLYSAMKDIPNGTNYMEHFDVRDTLR